MRLVVQNTVRDPETLAIRRSFPGEVIPAPVIGTEHLPPRRSRIVESSALTQQDVRTLADMTRYGVLKVYHHSPFLQVSEEELRSWLTPVAPPVETRVVEEEIVQVEEPVPALEVVEPAEPVLDYAAEPAAVDESPVSNDSESPSQTDLAASLSSLRMAELRTKLIELGGGPVSGLSKAQLIAAILERL
jgi:hypothetical protein